MWRHPGIHTEGTRACCRFLMLHSLNSLSPWQCDLIVLSWPASLRMHHPKPLPARAGRANDLLRPPGSRSQTIWTDVYEQVRVFEEKRELWGFKIVARVKMNFFLVQVHHIFHIAWKLQNTRCTEVTKHKIHK